MCPHDDFEILYYYHGILIRKCKSCKQVEVILEYHTDINELRNVIKKF